MKVEKILKALAHRNRLRILNLLERQELCVCELENLMEANQSNVSRHLSKLKNADIIESHRDAQWIYYALNRNFIKKHSFLQEIISEEFEDNIFHRDREKLKIYLQSNLTCKDLRQGKDILSPGEVD